ncbi:hypothetical protein SNE40_021965 [Patella caerulea]
MRSVLAKIDNDDTIDAAQVCKNVNVLDAIRFKKCGILTDIDNMDSEDEDDRPLSEIRDLMLMTQERLGLKELMTVDEYLDMNSDLPVCEEFGDDWERQLIEEAKNSKDGEIKSSVVGSDSEDME